MIVVGSNSKTIRKVIQHYIYKTDYYILCLKHNSFIYFIDVKNLSNAHNDILLNVAILNLLTHLFCEFQILLAPCLNINMRGVSSSFQIIAIIYGSTEI